MGYGFIPENKKAKDIRIDNYNNNFPSNINNVESALDYLKDNAQSDIDLSNYATTDDLNAKADKNNLVATNSISMGRSGSTTYLSTAIGKNVTASGLYSFATGDETQATSHRSFSQGCETIASAFDAHAEGYKTQAKSNQSHSEGLYTIASSNVQHVQGKYNIEDSNNKYAHIVGNGTDSARSNAHTLSWDGVGWFAGDLYTGGTGQDDANAKKIATEEFVNNIISNLLSFNDSGELVVTIGDVSKTFVAKTE